MNLTHTLNRLLTRLEHSVTNAVHLTATTAPIVAQITGLADSFYRAELLQTKSLALGLDLKKVLTANYETLKDMPGGAMYPLQEQIKLLEIGLKQPNKNLLELATVMKLTNQNSDLLISNMASLVAMGGITNKQISILSEDLNKTSNTYKISLDSLNRSIQQIIGNLPELNIFGNTQVVTNAVARVAGSFGELYIPQITKLIGIMVNGSDESINQLSRLGIRQQAFNLTQATTIAEAEADIRQAINIMASQSSLLAQTYKQLGPQGASIARTIYGDALDIGLSMSRALENGYGVQKELTGKLTNFTNSIQALTQAYIEPLQRLALNVLPPLIDTLIVLKAPLLGIAATLAGRGVVGLLGNVLGPILGGGIFGAARFTSILGGLLRLSLVGGAAALLGQLFFGSKEEDSTNIKEIAKNTKEQADLAKAAIQIKDKASNDTINRLIAETLNGLMEGNASAIARENDRFYELVRINQLMHKAMEDGNRLMIEQTGVIEKGKPVTSPFSKAGVRY